MPSKKKTAPKQKKASFESVIKAKAIEFQQSVKGLMASVEVEIASAATLLNKLGGAQKIALYLKSQKITGTSSFKDCPVQQFIQSKLDKAFGSNYFDQQVEVDCDCATLNCTVHIDALANDVGGNLNGWGNTYIISVKLGKNVKKFIENFDGHEGSEEKNAYTELQEA